MRIFNSTETANLINTIYDEFVGNSEVTENNTTSLVDKGQAISNSITIENFRNIATGLFDRIGKIVYAKISAPETDYNIHVDSTEYGSMLEKIFISPIEFETSFDYDTTNSSTFSDMFDYHALQITGKVYNSIATYRTKPYSISMKMLKSMFINADELTAFIGAVSNMIVTVYNMVRHESEKRVVNTLASVTALDTNVTRVIDLLKVCKDETGVTYTTSNYNCESFWRWAYAYMSIIADYMRAPSAVYNDGSRIASTDTNDLRCVMPSKYKKYADMYAFTDAFNKDEIPHINTISTPCLQGRETPDKIIVRSEIAPTKSVTIENIVGIMYDMNGAFISTDIIETGTNTNDYDKHTNYVHLFNVRMCVDSSENCVVFVIKDASGTNKAYTVTTDT